MSVEFVSASSEYYTFDLNPSLFLGGLGAYLPISIFCKYKWNTGGSEDGALSFASTAGTTSYTAFQIDASGFQAVWHRGLASNTETSDVDIRSDGLWHSTLVSYRERGSGLIRSRVHFDGDRDVQTQANAGTQAAIDDFFRIGVGLSDYATTPGGYGDVEVDTVAVWHADLQTSDAVHLHKLKRSPVMLFPDRLIHYTIFDGARPRDLITGAWWVIGGGTPIAGVAGDSISQPPAFSPAYGTIDPYSMANSKYAFLRRIGFVPAAPAGGLSIPVAMHHYTKNIGAA